MIIDKETAIKIKEFRAEAEEKNPEWVRERRMVYLYGQIQELAKDIAEDYKNFMKQKEDDIPYWFRKVSLSWRRTHQKEKKLERLKFNYRFLRYRKDIKGQIDELMVIKAREYPITELIEHRGLWAICPFHNDHNPSLYLRKNFYHCFSCGANGDAIDLIIKLEGLNFVEAVKRLNI